MSIPIEDLAEDVVGKAQSGLGLSDGELAEQCGADRQAIRQLRKGTFCADTARVIAPSLGLDADALIALGEKTWYPDPIELDGLAQINTPHPVPGYEEMTVNAYLIADPATGQAAAFDTGADASPLIAMLQRKGWTLQSIYITHTHRDHIKDLSSLKARLEPGGKVYAHPSESLTGATELRDGESFTLGSLKITARVTSGHSPGGTSFIVEGLARTVAIVGDAIFAGSIGGVRANYRLALKMIREHILSLPGEAILCPGHGPMTTVTNEQQRNPFFAGDF
ncbi:MBL fold metallo-hydrolase [Cerasicoccus fimbriatus]|uniref:MBL fold metallo-hydrolase n=1 Tax=Cerasicoccus fimbriatus TaxID=3014554 RepID=UPI0022B4516A|nr:MBL fold metallo-hydrolase [Cerasicoccus sp. TK19100]